MRKFMRTRAHDPPSPSPSRCPSPPPAAPPRDPPAHKNNGHANGGALRDDRHSELSRYWSGSEASGALFEDTAFPPARALGLARLARAAAWPRPHELCARPRFRGDDGADELPDHLSERWRATVGAAGDAHVCVAAAALAPTPRLLDRAAPPQSFRKRYTGAFRFRFWVFGEWREVVVDDRLPARGARLLGSRAAHDDFTLPLLEKAYAKLHGSYAALRGGSVARALQELSGGIVQSFSLRLQPRALTFQVLNSAVPRSTLLVATAPRGAPGGLLPAAPYAVTGLARVRAGGAEGAGGALVRLRAGSARGEWRGAWAPDSEEWRALAPPDRELLAPRADRPGDFWPAPTVAGGHWLPPDARGVSRGGWDDVVRGLRTELQPAGAAARGARRLAAGARLARQAALARCAGAAALAARAQRRRAPRCAPHRRQPAVPRAGAALRARRAQVPRRGVRHAAVRRGRRRAQAARYRLRGVRAGHGRPAARPAPAWPASAGRDARVARARGGHVLHAATGPLPGGAAHAPPAHRRHLPVAHPHRRAHRRVGGERGQRNRAQRAGRAARRRGAAGGGACGAGGGGRGGRAGRGGAARGAAARVARLPVRAPLAGAVPRAGAAARRGAERRHARERAAGAGCAAGVLARGLPAARGRAALRRGRVVVPAARATVGGRRHGQQQGAGVPGAAVRARHALVRRGLRDGAGAPAPRARAIPQPRHEDEVQPALPGRDDPDDDLLVSCADHR